MNVNLQDIVTALTDELRDNPHYDRQRTLKTVAADYDINPILLARKFQEVHGVALADWTPPVKADPAAIVAGTTRRRAQGRAARSRLLSDDADERRAGRQALHLQRRRQRTGRYKSH